MTGRHAAPEAELDEFALNQLRLQALVLQVTYDEALALSRGHAEVWPYLPDDWAEQVRSVLGRLARG